MADRLRSDILVNALVRLVNRQGGFAAVLAKGDAISGSLVLRILENGSENRLLERVADLAGGYDLADAGTRYGGDSAEITQYLERRRKFDPDLWVVELDVANAEQLVAELDAIG